MVLFTIPTVVVLSTCIGVGGCGWSNSERMSRMTLASFVLRNKALNSASAADAATSLRIAHVMAIFPFSLMGLPCWGKLPRKKYPPVLVVLLDSFVLSNLTLQ